MRIEKPEQLLLEELRDLYDAEKQLVRALPKMRKASSDSELSDALRNHLEETKEQVERLERAFDLLGSRAKSRPCKGMRGIVEEGSEIMQEDASETLADSAISGAGQKVENYEIAGYETAKSLAQAVGNRELAALLDETLQEERSMSKRLGVIAKRLVKEAQRSAGAESGTTSRAAGSRERRSSGRATARSKRASGASRSASRSGAPKGRGRVSGGTHRSRTSSTSADYQSRVTTDHDFIREWAEERKAHPACVRGTGGKGDIGMLRLDFPGYSGGESLERISWEDFFDKFEERGLALLYQEETSRGQKSNFNKIVSRETARGAA